MTHEELREIRERLPPKKDGRPWTQKDLAAALHVTEHHIWLMETGRRRITARTADQVERLRRDVEGTRRAAS